MNAQLRLAQLEGGSFGYVHVFADGSAKLWYGPTDWDEAAAQAAMEFHATAESIEIGAPGVLAFEPPASRFVGDTNYFHDFRVHAVPWQ